MSNKQPNATFLDGVTGVVVTNGTISVDETTFGAPGRAALVVTRNNASDVVTVQLPEVTGFTAGTMTEVFLHVGNTPTPMVVSLIINGTAYVIPMVKAAKISPAYRGLPDSLSFYYLKFKPTVGGNGHIRISGVMAGRANIAILKPFVDRVNAELKHKQCWQPGPHVNPDLNIVAWPTELPDFVPDSYAPTANPTLKAFTSDDGVESTSKITSRRRVVFRGELSLSMIDRERLEIFYQTTKGLFWFTRRDDQRVYQASWMADGEPTDSGLIKGQRRTAVGLNLRLI